MTDTDAHLPPIAAVPQAPAPDSVGQNRRGRKPLLNPDGTRVHPSRASAGTRRDRAPKRSVTATASASPRPRGTSLKTRIGGTLTTLSMVMSVVPPIAADALSPAEIELLADGIDKQCQQSPRFRKYVEQALGATGAGGLVAAVGIVAARRLGRHGILPPMVDPALGALIGDTFPAQATTTDALRASMPVQEPLVRSEENASQDTEPLVPWGAPGPIVEPPTGNGAFDYEAAATADA